MTFGLLGAFLVLSVAVYAYGRQEALEQGNQLSFMNTGQEIQGYDFMDEMHDAMIGYFSRDAGQDTAQERYEQGRYSIGGCMD
ncbi:hypothetical protein COY95_02125 [Candidatus Woesearchaeota archaeon CG_4_10_14_0_8_um_filter_47_5]|nr:MAG: hypothetical protein COY95_02125 [Candidatus Woesearchaeota archaeon CG_4_10_14_0_8_um_filter_47_5]